MLSRFLVALLPLALGGCLHLPPPERGSLVEPGVLEGATGTYADGEHDGRRAANNPPVWSDFTAGCLEKDFCPGGPSPAHAALENGPLFLPAHPELRTAEYRAGFDHGYRS